MGLAGGLADSGGIFPSLSELPTSLVIGGSASSPLAASTTFLPLPTATAATDTANLNTVLARGGVIRPNPLANTAAYSLTAPLVVPSNINVDFGGCTFTLTGQFNMLQNAAVTPVATATDAVTTVGSAVVASATLAPSAVAGQVLAVVGAGPPGGNGGGAIWLYGTVTGVAGNNITITNGGSTFGASVALTGATAYLFNRDSNIRISGGVWNGAAIWNTLATRQTAGFNSHLIRLRRVDGLTVEGATVQLSGFPQGGGWAFGINPLDCTDFLFEDCTGIGASTVVQGDGPLTRGTVRNVRGQTQDDMVAFGCVGFQGNDGEGDITGVLVDGVQANGSWRAVDLFAGQGGNGIQRTLRTAVRSVKGTTIHEGVRLTDYSGAGAGPLYVQTDDVTVTPGAGFQGIANTATNGNLVRPRNLFHPSDSGFLLSSFDPADATGSFVLGGGFIYLVMLKAPAPVTATNLLAVVKTAGGTLTSGQCWAGIYNSNGNLIAQSADQSSAWTSTGIKTMALTPQGSFTLDLPGGPGVFYWAAFLANGTTKPTFVAKGPTNMLMQIGFGSPYTAVVPGARHRVGYESVGSRTSLVSLNGLSLGDTGFFTMLWAGVT